MPPRQAIFGGTFDPPHAGHVAAAICAREQLDIDMLHIVVANDPWQKSAERVVTPAHHRLAMARLAFRDVAGTAVSDLEIRRGGPTYTIDTVAQLTQPGAETVLVMGPAAASGVTTWHRAAELAERVTLAVVQPPGEPPIHVEGWRTEIVLMEPVEASATFVRELLTHRAHQEIPPQVVQLVPPAVMSYIVECRLYSP
ncbi:nicotinate (nicotinamide) nucleotide adenylyltransferase [Candidatus Poriferisodalis sp.]|uniref:nicotinate (nicotinamide) nucleotide adenylyltransferase n=1 Tax=Candidatus Poriferisodalis sp. TaxID=3101277 RepID=UPI003B5B6077